MLSFLMPAIVAQPLHGFQDDALLRGQSYQDPFKSSHLITYDEVLQYLDDIESGALEVSCNAQV